METALELQSQRPVRSDRCRCRFDGLRIRRFLGRLAWRGAMRRVVCLAVDCLDRWSSHHPGWCYWFLIPATIHLACTLLISDKEYSFNGGVLPHTRLVQHELTKDFVAIDYRNMSSSELKAYTTNAARSRLGFVHLLTTCVFGYLGLRFATETHRQSIADA